MNTAVVDHMLSCRACDRRLHHTATACPGCGAVQIPFPGLVSDLRILPTAALCFFLGWLGIHRFYAGKVGTGLLQLVTVGGLGIWAFVDFILLITEVFKDGDGRKITEWT